MLALLMSVTVSPLMAGTKQGSDSGGGGGVYKIAPGKYLTLPEAGILIADKKDAGKRFEKYFTISEETKTELQSIIVKLRTVIPALDLRYEYIVPSRDTFVVKDVDQAQYIKIKGEYNKVFNSYGYKLSDEKFVLPAYSTITKNAEGETKFKTYILPDFVLLSAQQQAKILIHEYNMRKELKVTREEKLRQVLAVDVIINDMLNGKDVLVSNLKHSLKSFNKVGILEPSAVVSVVISRMEKQIKRSLTVDDLFLKDNFTFRRYNYGDIQNEIDPSLVQELQEKEQLSENYAELLEGAALKMILDYSNGEVSKELRKELGAVCEKEASKNEEIKYLSIKSEYLSYAFQCEANIHFGANYSQYANTVDKYVSKREVRLIIDASELVFIK